MPLSLTGFSAAAAAAAAVFQSPHQTEGGKSKSASASASVVSTIMIFIECGGKSRSVKKITCTFLGRRSWTRFFKNMLGMPPAGARLFLGSEKADRGDDVA